MENIQVTYRGFDIRYKENDECWSCCVDGSKQWEKQTLKECKKLIDVFYKKQVMDIPCIYICDNTYSGGFGSKKIVTSVSENGDVWVKDEKGNREKINAYSAKTDLALFNDANILLVDKYRKQLDIVEAERQKAKDILKEFELFNPGV